MSTADPDPGQLAARLRSERGRLGFTQVRTAEVYGTSRPTYAHIEAGRRTPHATGLRRLVAEGFDLSPLFRPEPTTA